MEASDAWRHLRLENEGILMWQPFHFIVVLPKNNKALAGLATVILEDPSSSSSLPTFMYVKTSPTLPNSGCQI
jgi:hypothetical protein